MSYLHPVRLHFAGRFQANVSTVNNDPGHFDNATFQANYQQMQSAEAMNGWFNPEGDGSWRLMGCRVTSAWSATSIDHPLATDPVLGLLVADADDATSAKLVDLDPEQQMVSMIFGMQIRLADPDGVSVLRSVYEPAPFIDIWDRAHHQRRRRCRRRRDVPVGALRPAVGRRQRVAVPGGAAARRHRRTAVDQVQHRRDQHELQVAGLHERPHRRHDRTGDEGRAAALRRRPPADGHGSADLADVHPERIGQLLRRHGRPHRGDADDRPRERIADDDGRRADRRRGRSRRLGDAVGTGQSVRWNADDADHDQGGRLHGRQLVRRDRRRRGRAPVRRPTLRRRHQRDLDRIEAAPSRRTRVHHRGRIGRVRRAPMASSCACRPATPPT